MITRINNFSKIKKIFIVTLWATIIYSLFLALDFYKVDYHLKNESSVGVNNVLLQPNSKPRVELLSQNGVDSIAINANFYSRVFVKDKHNITAIKIYEVFDFLIFVFAFLIVIKLFRNFYRFVNSISRKEFFIKTNISRLITIGICCILLEAIFIIEELYTFYLQKFLFENLPYTVVPELSFSGTGFLFGIVFLTIAYAFKKGIELQQENDLTV